MKNIIISAVVAALVNNTSAVKVNDGDLPTAGYRLA